jgi:hypothetical protein
MLAGVTNSILQAVQEVEEGMISVVNEAEFENEVIMCPTPQTQYHIVHVQF